MLNSGTTALPYEPYIPPTNYALPSPVALPDGCSVKAGYVDADKVVQFDGSEDWKVYGGATNTYYYDFPVFAKGEGTSLCNFYTFYSYSSRPIENGKFSIQGNQRLIFCDFAATNLELWREVVSKLAQKGTPLTIYCQSTSYAGEKMPVWLVNVTKKKVVLDGTENWKWQKTGANVYRGVFSYIAPAQYPICSHAKSVTTYENTNGVIIADNAFSISLPTFQTEESFNGFKNYISAQFLAGTPITFVHVLATTETYAIPYTRCESPDTVNCTISTPEGTCSAQYNADLKTYIDRLQSAIIALGGTI